MFLEEVTTFTIHLRNDDNVFAIQSGYNYYIVGIDKM